MRENLIQDLESFLHGQDFGRNWDGAYQDVISTIQRYFDSKGFETRFVSESESPSHDTELVARKEQVVVRVPWEEDYNRRSLVYVDDIQVQQPVC